MSWIGWLLLLAGLYLLIVPVRGIVQFVSWYVEEHIVEPRQLRHLGVKSLQRPPEPRSPAAPDGHETEVEHEETRREAARIPVTSVRQTRRPSFIGRLQKSFKSRVFNKGYEDWVADALSEDELTIKVEYLSKALKLNPAYLPAWGMKGYALFELERYEEALACFEKSLELRPNALTRYKKGLCCFHLKRHEEAVKCFIEAMQECAGRDRQLLEDASRMKKLLEDELQSVEAPAS